MLRSISQVAIAALAACCFSSACNADPNSESPGSKPESASSDGEMGDPVDGGDPAASEPVGVPGSAGDASAEVSEDRPGADEPAAGDTPGLEGLMLISDDPPDSPLPGLADEWQQRFDSGDAHFEAVFRASQGLGPLYIRHSCASCHADDARGPGAVRKMVNLSEDGINPDADQSMFPNGHTVRPQSVDPSRIQSIEVPEEFDGLWVTSRMGPPVFGRGAMEAILDSELERLEREQSERDDGISGRINRVTYSSKPNPESEFHQLQTGDSGLIGRFGLKARIATLDEFTADAYQGDMGITSPLRPEELSNPDGLEDDDRPGVDVDLETVNVVADYVRLLRIPPRRTTSARGEMLFGQVGCAVCHVPTLATKPDYPVEAWAGTDVAVYTDMLLHSMGEALADGMEDGDAKGDEWRTAPLIGLRMLRGYLHDSRADTISDAIAAHASVGSEANAVVEAFDELPSDDQQALVEFVEGL